ncbi:hypothetical protein ACFL21_00975 [Patescibacteria group bacterium]
MDFEITKKDFCDCLETLNELLDETDNRDDLMVIRRELLELIGELEAADLLDEEIEETLHRVILENQEKLQLYLMDDEESEDCLIEEALEMIGGGEDFEDGNWEEIEPIDLEAIFVPTDDDFFIREGFNGGIFEKAGHIERIELAFEVLRSLGVEKVLRFKGEFYTRTVRELSYEMIVVPELKRVILLCEEEGNRTFVRKGIVDLPSFYKKTKSQLKNDPEVVDFIWKDPVSWKNDLKRYLLEDWSVEEAKSHGNLVRNYKYYSNSENLRADLDNFAQACGIENSTMIKATSDFFGRDFTYRTGETIKFVSYLARAGRSLGIAKSKKEANSKRAEILRHLLIIAGYLDEIIISVPRDEGYYKNRETVKADLDNYAKKWGLKSPLDLGLGRKFLYGELSCFNGESVTFITYLNNAGMQLGIAKNSREASSIKKIILKFLLRVAGYDVPNYAPRDIIYYSDSRKVKSDLEGFAQKCGIDSPLDLSINPQFTKEDIECSNGEIIKFNTYINHVGITLELYSTCKEANSNRSKILKALLKIAGYNIDDKKRRKQTRKPNRKNSLKKGLETKKLLYPDKPEILRKELEKFAKKCGIESPVHFSAGNKFQQEKIELSSGREVSFNRYLVSVAINFQIANTRKEVLSRISSVLGAILNIAGYEKRDFNYYNNPLNLRKDLEKYAELWDLESPLDIRVSPKFVDRKLKCVNGENVRLGAYLNNAAVALKIVKKAKLAYSQRARILKILLKRAGFEIEEYSLRDFTYYSDPEKVKSDLEGFARKCEIDSPLDLSISPRFTKEEIQCFNGETIKFNRYITHAGVALEMSRTAAEANSMRSKILKVLLRIAGYNKL